MSYSPWSRLFLTVLLKYFQKEQLSGAEACAETSQVIVKHLIGLNINI